MLVFKTNCTPWRRLRGLAALHVAVGHFSTFGLGVDLLGGSAMTLFYLLSGFVMMLGYGDRKDDEPPLNVRKFLQNRFARLAPVYYLTNILGVVVFWVMIPSETSDFGKLMSAVLSLFGLSSWVSPMYAWGWFPPNAVTWTITTMGWFYVLFPTGLQKLGAESGFRPRKTMSSFFLLKWGVADTVPFQPKPNTPF